MNILEKSASTWLVNNRDKQLFLTPILEEPGVVALDVELSTDITTEELNTLQAEYDAQQYARDRAAAYPSLQDQADMQFHDLANGTTTWLDAIQAVKDANPKP